MRVVATAGTPCYDCGVRVGKQHRVGCDVARCVVDGEQHLQHVLFGFGETEDSYPGRCSEECAPEIWSGIWPGVQEAEERGWYSIFVEGKGWTSVPAGTPGATADLNRIHVELVWDPVTRKRVDKKHV
jgi:hypothetical protein